MHSGSTVIDVVEADAETWDVREPGSDRPLSSWFSRAQAVRAATTMLREGRGGEVRVRTFDGGVESIGVLAGKRPWWQMTKRPWGAFLLGGTWLIIGGTQLASGAAVHGAIRVFAVITLLMALAVLASGVAQVRRSRR